MGPILPVLVFCPDQAQIDLIDQLRGLQGVALTLAIHHEPGQAPEFREHQIEEFVFDPGTSLAPFVQELALRAVPLPEGEGCA